MLRIQCNHPDYKTIIGLMLFFLLFVEVFLLLLSPMLVLPVHEQKIILDKPILAKSIGIMGKQTPVHLKHRQQKYNFICNNLTNENGDNACHAIIDKPFVQIEGWTLEPNWLPKAYSRQIMIEQMALLKPNGQVQIWHHHRGIGFDLSWLFYEKCMTQAFIVIGLAFLTIQFIKVKITFKNKEINLF